jgi:hypothetical protein
MPVAVPKDRKLARLGDALFTDPLFPSADIPTPTPVIWSLSHLLRQAAMLVCLF